MASPEEEPSIDPPEEEFDLNKPYWVGYFRLPVEDVKSHTLFQPNYGLLPTPPTIIPPCNMRVGRWAFKGYDEKREVKQVLIKVIDAFHEREARILSSMSGSDALANKYNIVRFYGATINEMFNEYQLVLEFCDMYLQDYVLDKSYPLQWHEVAKSLCKQIANGMRYLHWKAPYNPIIHRDLHPLSVLITLRPDGDVTAKLYGFQHAKILGEHETIGLDTVAPVSAEVWQAPEYVLHPSETRSSPEEDYMMVDVYSYAILVWHIFTRQLPYDGKEMVLYEIVTKILQREKRPDIPKDIPKFWRQLMRRAWHEKPKKRPDFIKIYKAIENEDATILDPHCLLPVEAEMRPQWQLDPKDVPQAFDHIISNKMNTLSVVLQSEDGKVVLKRPIKENEEPPSEEEFKQFMEFSAGLNHPNILCYDGVFFLESLQMTIMRCSVRQFCEGKLVKRDGNKAKQKCSRGWFNMRPKCVKQVAVGVAKGLSYLHTVKNVSHDGLSSSNVLLNYYNPGNIVEVKLVDYQLGLLGISSQSHADSNCMYQAPEGTDPKRADLYSLGVLMVYMWKGEPRGKGLGRQDDWERRTRRFKNDAVPAMARVWEKVVSKCLDTDQFPSLTADEVVSALEALNMY